METELTKIARIAKEKPKEKMQSLAGMINKETLGKAHKEMSTKKATGVDQVTKDDYDANLSDNLDGLVERMKRQAYKPQPVKRVYIPKAGSEKMRPLGIPAYEDKLVQKVLSNILNAVFEQDFLDCSYGFRPNRNCHDALQNLNTIIRDNNVNFIVDADIKGFFDTMSHDWIMEFVRHRIADKNIERLIARFLKSGTVENGEYRETDVGAPQGGNISPILGNLYLHHVLDLWFEIKFKKTCKGEAYMVRYADDSVFCFQYQDEANRFYEEMKIRLGKFNLEIQEDKTKIIRFGRWAKTDCGKDGMKKPETFDFLGFTHYCGTNTRGQFKVKRKTSKKKFRVTMMKMKKWLRSNLTTPAKQVMKDLKIKMSGYLRHYSITDNWKMVKYYIYEVRRMLYKMFNRRSQKKSMDWSKYAKFLLKYPLVTPKIYVIFY